MGRQDLLRRSPAGNRQKTEAVRLVDNVRIENRREHEPTACSGDGPHIFEGKGRPGTDEKPLLRGKGSDRVEGARCGQGDLENGEPPSCGGAARLEDRFFRPLIERYPNVAVDTSQYLLDGGIEAFVADYGSRRMLYGSGFPESYFGGMMMAIKNAQIPSAAKEAIAHGNLERIIEETRL